MEIFAYFGFKEGHEKSLSGKVNEKLQKSRYFLYKWFFLEKKNTG